MSSSTRNDDWPSQPDTTVRMSSEPDTTADPATAPKRPTEKRYTAALNTRELAAAQANELNRIANVLEKMHALADMRDRKGYGYNR